MLLDKRYLEITFFIFSTSFVVGIRWNCLIETISTYTDNNGSVSFTVKPLLTNFSTILIVFEKNSMVQ